MRKINKQYAAIVLIDILYEKNLINRATYKEIQNKYKPEIYQNNFANRENTENRETTENTGIYNDKNPNTA